ncbi:MAG TPA: hypothetical protein VGM38_10555 [Pseudolysinimonas sp.]|jgi:hypothetical protein
MYYLQFIKKPTMQKRIGITGSRNLSNLHPLREFLLSLPADTTIVVGDNGNVDILAASIAAYRGFRLIIYRADWRSYGKAAGPIRNGCLIRDGITALYAFPSDPASISPGTADCIRQAKKAGIPVFIK